MNVSPKILKLGFVFNGLAFLFLTLDNYLSLEGILYILPRSIFVTVTFGNLILLFCSYIINAIFFKSLQIKYSFLPISFYLIGIVLTTIYFVMLLTGKKSVDIILLLQVNNWFNIISGVLLGAIILFNVVQIFIKLYGIYLLILQLFIFLFQINKFWSLSPFIVSIILSLHFFILFLIYIYFLQKLLKKEQGNFNVLDHGEEPSESQ